MVVWLGVVSEGQYIAMGQTKPRLVRGFAMIASQWNGA